MSVQLFGFVDLSGPPIKYSTGHVLFFSFFAPGVSCVTRVGVIRGGNWGYHPCFFLKKWQLFWSSRLSFCQFAVSPIFIFSWKTDDLFTVTPFIDFTRVSPSPLEGVTPHLSYLSDLVCKVSKWHYLWLRFYKGSKLPFFSFVRVLQQVGLLREALEKIAPTYQIQSASVWMRNSKTYTFSSVSYTHLTLPTIYSV